jgi:hypothetical protein
MIDLYNHFFREEAFLLDQLQWDQLAPRNGVRLTGVCK